VAGQEVAASTPAVLVAIGVAALAYLLSNLAMVGLLGLEQNF